MVYQSWYTMTSPEIGREPGCLCWLTGSAEDPRISVIEGDCPLHGVQILRIEETLDKGPSLCIEPKPLS